MRCCSCWSDAQPHCTPNDLRCCSSRSISMLPTLVRLLAQQMPDDVGPGCCRRGRLLYSRLLGIALQGVTWVSKSCP